MKPGRLLPGLLALVMVLAGCAEASRELPEVRCLQPAYAAIWAEREAHYQQESTDRSRGARAVLRAFNTYRASEPSPGGIENWLRTRHAVHRARLLGLGIGPEEMEAMAGDRTGRAAPVSEAARSVAFNIGALAEVRRVYREVASLIAGLPPGSDTAPSFNSPPVLPGQYSPLVHGLFDGFDATLGR